MRYIVTGAAGFIGSVLCDRLLELNHDVVGIDSMTDYYDVAIKAHNLASARTHPRFEFVDRDLIGLNLEAMIEGADAVFHLAGQPGVRLSWSKNFSTYVERNINATQALLEACRVARPGRIVNASSSSVYGNQAVYPCLETSLPAPHNPYGVTKLAAEQLCSLYAANWSLDVVSLRFFTVYGPRQRPDMGMHRFIAAALSGGEVPLFGDGGQIRDFTYVDDVVAAVILAATSDLAPGTVMNIAGSESTSVADVLGLVSDQTGGALRIAQHPAQLGDVARTGGSIELAQRLLGWEPLITIEDGVRRQCAWHEKVLRDVLKVT